MSESRRKLMLTYARRINRARQAAFTDCSPLGAPIMTSGYVIGDVNAQVWHRHGNGWRPASAAT
jgi:hypothetical protein